MLLRFLFILCFVGFASAQNPYEMGSPKLTNINTLEFGGDQNAAFIQGDKDLLYVANGSGLLEFNGVTWQLIQTEHKSSIYALAKNDDGKIFVGGLGFLGYVEYSKSGKANLISLKHLLPDDFQINTVWHIIILNGKVYFSNEDQLLEYDYKAIKIIESPNRIQSLFLFNNELIINDNDGLYTFKDNTWHHLENSNRIGNAMVNGIFQDVKGDTIVVSSIEGLSRYKNKTLTRIDNPVSNFLVKEKNAGFITELDDGRIAIGTLTGGALIINRDLTPYYRINDNGGLKNNFVRGFFQDNNYGLWIACNQGVAKISYPIQSTFFTHNEKKFNVILNINSYKDEVYVLSLTEVLKLKPSNIEKLLSDKPYAELEPFLKETDGFASHVVDDKILFATLYGTVAYNGKDFERIDRLAARSFYQSKKDTSKIFIGNYRGLHVLDVKDLGVNSPQKIGSFETQVKSIAEDEHGYLWLGTLSQGIIRLKLDDDYNVIEELFFTEADGLPNMNYNFVYNTKSNSLIFSSQNGFYEFDYTSQKFSPSDEFGSEFKDSPGLVYALEYTDNDAAWFSNYSWQQTVLFQKDSTEEKGYKHNIFPEVDPLAVNSIHQSKVDDAVWVGGVELARIEPNAIKLKSSIKHYSVISKMIIAEDSLLIDGANFDKSIDRELTLKDRRVRFEVGATDYEKYLTNQFQYKLDGQDDDWSQWTTENFKIYTNLDTGDYTFKVRSRNIYADVLEGEEIKFSVNPFWYETLWFKLLLAALCVLLIAYVTSYFSKRKFVKRVHELELKQQFEDEKNQAIINEQERGIKAMIQAQENERGRIARDLHDGVVQQIGSLILKGRTLFKNTKDTNEANQFLEDLENSNQDLRHISHQMMPRALKELGMISAISDMLESSLNYSKINYQFEHFNIDERLPEKIEITVYRITQELVNNIIKHSNANQVNVQLFKSDNNVILIVEDDGIGIGQEKPSEGIGLLNISSRVDMVQGTVNFEPSPNSGTLVTVKIPIVDVD